MQSRRDQVNAQRNLAARLTCALVRADPDALESPTRRDLRGLAGGALLTLLVLLGVAGWALLFSGGSTAWRQPGALVIDSSSGASFVYVGGVLRPVRNAASARLLVEGPVDPVVVSADRIADVPRGAPIGIPDGPELLPTAERLNTGVWRACAGTAAGAEATAGAEAAITLEIGSPPAADRPGADEAVLVAADGRQYLLWRGRRHPLTRPWTADVLGYGGAPPVEVPPRWLELLPTGPDLAPPPVAGRGTPGPAVGARPAAVGGLFAVQAGGEPAYYLLLPEGLAPLTPVQLALVLGEAGGETGAAGAEVARQISPADLVAAPHTVLAAPQRQLPARPPRLAEPAATNAVCVESPGVPPVPPAPARVDGRPVPRSAAASDTVLDLVFAPPAPAPGPRLPTGTAVQVRSDGGALLVPDADLPAKDQPALLVDGSGTAFTLTPDAVEALGYAPERALAVPQVLPLLLGRGPPLDVLAAR